VPSDIFARVQRKGASKGGRQRKKKAQKEEIKPRGKRALRRQALGFKKRNALLYSGEKMLLGCEVQREKESSQGKTPD